MIAETIYNRVRNNTGRTATTLLKHVFNLHADKAERLARNVERRAQMFTSGSESKNARRCAAIIDEIGIDRFSVLRQWVPVEMPETLNTLTLETLRENLENILSWEKKNPPSPA